jgi:hypothetical protein
MRVLLLSLLFVLPLSGQAQSEVSRQAQPAQIMFLGVFHFDNPGRDAVRYRALDVMQPQSQAYLVQFAQRLAKFAPTKVLLEYPEAKDAAINQQYTNYLAGRESELPRNEIYQLGFRVARLAGLVRVHSFDTPAPAQEEKLWEYLSSDPEANSKLMALIESESKRLQELHDTKSLKDILALSNSEGEDRRNKGFYMLLNPVGVDQGLFHGADASANWWHRNLRMYALIQRHAVAGERVLVIAGSGHTAVLREFLRADSERVEEPVLDYF